MLHSVKSWISQHSIDSTISPSQAAFAACFCLKAALAAMYMFATFLHACRYTYIAVPGMPVEHQLD